MPETINYRTGFMLSEAFKDAFQFKILIKISLGSLDELVCSCSSWRKSLLLPPNPHVDSAHFKLSWFVIN